MPGAFSTAFMGASEKVSPPRGGNQPNAGTIMPKVPAITGPAISPKSSRRAPLAKSKDVLVFFITIVIALGFLAKQEPPIPALFYHSHP